MKCNYWFETMIHQLLAQIDLVSMLMTFEASRNGSVP